MILNPNPGRRWRSNLLASQRNELPVRQLRSGQTPLRFSQTPTRTNSDTLPFSSELVRPGLSQSDLISPKPASLPGDSNGLSNFPARTTRLASFTFMRKTRQNTVKTNEHDKKNTPEHPQCTREWSHSKQLASLGLFAVKSWLLIRVYRRPFAVAIPGKSSCPNHCLGATTTAPTRKIDGSHSWSTLCTF